MSERIRAGARGVIEVIQLIRCPNCRRALTELPTSYPLYDIQCTGCAFRAQVKSANSKPKEEILGAGWDVLDKVMKAGFIVPPLILNFKWEERGIARHRILFYPFIPRSNLKKRQLGATAQRANYRMYNYVGLDTLPCFVLYSK